jgi:hypothetical protein
VVSICATLFNIQELCILPAVCMLFVTIGSLVVSMLAIGQKIREFKPDRLWIFKGDKSQ